MSKFPAGLSPDVDQPFHGARNQWSITKHPKQEFEGLRQRLDPVRDLRNHIAHGYLVFHLNGGTEAPEISISLPKDIDHQDKNPRDVVRENHQTPKG